MCLDHPHHSVFIVMALAHADKDAEYSTSSGGQPAAKRPRLATAKSNRDEYVIDEVSGVYTSRFDSMPSSLQVCSHM